MEGAAAAVQQAAAAGGGGRAAEAAAAQRAAVLRLWAGDAAGALHTVLRADALTADFVSMAAAAGAADASRPRLKPRRVSWRGCFVQAPRII